MVRLWAVLTIGLLAGAIGDAGTEYFGAFGWLGGVARDVDHQGVLPVFVFTLMLALGLVVYIAGSRISPGDALVRRLDDTRGRALDALAAFAIGCVTVIGIEGYETGFGGLAPFDPHSVIVAHAPILALSFVTIAVGARIMLGAAIGFAARSRALVAAIFTWFLRIPRAFRATSKHAAQPHPEANSSPVAAERTRSRGRRAPPQTLPVLA
ncbi:MAG TPA: hypothetical protein VHX17_08880 [Candidatus Cybelea sp.]|jgi:hypothetical protein|nr:hypothetical protein [Candidatus Cybelea sp.]